jgi:hypothetical protein
MHKCSAIKKTIYFLCHKRDSKQTDLHVPATTSAVLTVIHPVLNTYKKHKLILFSRRHLILLE